MGMFTRRQAGESHIHKSPWYTANTSLVDDLLKGRPGKALPVFSRDTNMHPAFGVEPKIQRNKLVVNSVYNQTQGYMLIGDRVQETLSDPLKRKPAYILQSFREGGSPAGRSRGNMRPAAPQQVQWKNQYWMVQRPPYRQPIGPFTQGQLQDQSILSRINSFMHMRGQ